MRLDPIKIGPSIRIENFEKILEERKDKVKINYKGGQNHLPGFDILPYQVTIGFTEKEFQKLLETADSVGKKLTELIHEIVIQHS